MNENEKKNGWLSILGYVALIVVLFIGIKVVFAGLGRVIPKTEDIQPQFTALNNREGQQVSYSLRLLTDEEMQSEEVQQWLDRAREQAEPDTGAYWLVRLEEDDYLLCLPDQDRSLSPGSFTATEERDPDGMIALVLRIRTPETGMVIFIIVSFMILSFVIVTFMIALFMIVSHSTGKFLFVSYIIIYNLF